MVRFRRLSGRGEPCVGCLILQLMLMQLWVLSLLKRETQSKVSYFAATRCVGKGADWTSSHQKRSVRDRLYRQVYTPKTITTCNEARLTASLYHERHAIRCSSLIRSHYCTLLPSGRNDTLPSVSSVLFSQESPSRNQEAHASQQLSSQAITT